MKIMKVNKTRNDNIYNKYYRVNKFIRKSIGKKKGKIFKWKKYNKEDNKLKNKENENNENKDFQI